MECEHFWCVWTECTSYNNGSVCGTCEHNNRCEDCCLQNSGKKPERCKEIERGLKYGIWENES